MPEVKLADALKLRDRRRTKDGFLSVEATIARTGIQDYFGYEVGRPEVDFVRVYRPDEEVFDTASLQTFAGRPITNDHPSIGDVSADNWKDLSVGHIGGVLKKDGDYIVAPLAIMDASAIAAIEDGKREVSMGYTADLEWTPGTTADGEKYDAIQRNIRINHLAIVDRGRAGGARIIDKENRTMKTITIDGVSVQVADDAAAQIITKALDAAEKAKAEAEKALADAKAANAKLDAEKTAAEDAKAEAEKALADATAPEAIAKAAEARSKVIGDAKRIAPTMTVADAASTEDIRRAALVARKGEDFVKGIEAKHGDAAPIAIETLFETYADAAEAAKGGANPSATKPTLTADAARDAFNAKLRGEKTQDKE